MGSVIAAAVSELAFLLLYGPVGSGPRIASALAFVAGAVPRYVLSRRWAWGRRGRSRLGREVLPYVVVVVATAALAMFMTSVAEGFVQRVVAAPTLRVVLVGAVFLLTFGAMFVVKFVVFDRVV